MKIHRYILATLTMLGLALLSGCDYLNIVPDGTSTEKDAFANPKAAERYLYSCYGYIPAPSQTSGLDFLTGDEVVTPFEHESWAHFPKGSYNATNPVISYWNSLFEGCRYCYALIDKVDGVPNIDPNVAADYKAQAEFLIGYFHYLLIQNYGSTIIIRGVEDINAHSEDFRPREPLDVCVAFVEEKLDNAIAKLPATREGNEYGLATSTAAKALKAKLRVMVASPLFNGYSALSELKNNDGTQLMPTTFDQTKWEKALEAAKESVAAAEAAGHKLYEDKDYELTAMPFPDNKTERSLRMALLDTSNSTEIVWGDTRGQGSYDIMPKSAPLYKDKWGWSGVGVTLNMMKRFYTEKGLPLAEDPSFPAESEWWQLITPPADYKNAEGQIPKFLYQREPRLYAWVTFQNGFYEIGGAGQYKNEQGRNTLYGPDYKRGTNKVIVKTMIGEVNGRGPVPDQLRNNDYNPTGFLNKKLVHPRKTPDQSKINYIHPYITLADLYLLLAEAAVECNQLDLAKQNLDKIRTRAGIPTVDVAWAQARTPGKANTKEGMRDIVRQERAIETYLTNQNFWDMRRWLLAEEYFDQKPKGMNVNSGTTLDSYTRVEEVDVTRSFTAPRNYFMPIPQGEINKNKNLVQNIGY